MSRSPFKALLTRGRVVGCDAEAVEVAWEGFGRWEEFGRVEAEESSGVTKLSIFQHRPVGIL